MSAVCAGAADAAKQNIDGPAVERPDALGSELVISDAEAAHQTEHDVQELVNVHALELAALHPVLEQLPEDRIMGAGNLH